MGMKPLPETPLKGAYLAMDVEHVARLFDISPSASRDALRHALAQPNVKQTLNEGVFGVPFFIVDGETIWAAIACG
jgi:hypothetical protein